MGTKRTALLVDDEVAIRKLLRASLCADYDTVEAESGEEAIRLTATNNPSVILLDLGLPDIDGIEAIRRIREFSTTPIIVLSAREQEQDKVQALDSGANDYLTKPFNVAELQARIRVVTRPPAAIPDSGRFQFGDVTVDVASRTVRKRDSDVHITPIEFSLLLLFLKNSERVLTHTQILTTIWGANYARQVQYLRVFMRNLRHKLESDPAQPKHFLTETGIGYRFRGEAE